MQKGPECRARQLLPGKRRLRRCQQQPALMLPLEDGTRRIGVVSNQSLFISLIKRLCKRRGHPRVHAPFLQLWAGRCTQAGTNSCTDDCLWTQNPHLPLPLEASSGQSVKSAFHFTSRPTCFALFGASAASAEGEAPLPNAPVFDPFPPAQAITWKHVGVAFHQFYAAIHTISLSNMQSDAGY